MPDPWLSVSLLLLWLTATRGVRLSPGGSVCRSRWWSLSICGDSQFMNYFCGWRAPSWCTGSLLCCRFCTEKHLDVTLEHEEPAAAVGSRGLYKKLHINTFWICAHTLTHTWITLSVHTRTHDAHVFGHQEQVWLLVVVLITTFTICAVGSVEINYFLTIVT